MHYMLGMRMKCHNYNCVSVIEKFTVINMFQGTNGMFLVD